MYDGNRQKKRCIHNESTNNKPLPITMKHSKEMCMNCLESTKEMILRIERSFNIRLGKVSIEQPLPPKRIAKEIKSKKVEDRETQRMTSNPIETKIIRTRIHKSNNKHSFENQDKEWDQHQKDLELLANYPEIRQENGTCTICDNKFHENIRISHEC